MTSKAYFIQSLLLMTSLKAESISPVSWKKVTSLVTPKHRQESGLWRVFRVVGVIQCGVVCGQEDDCNSFQYSTLTGMCSGFHAFAAHDVTDRGVVSYVKSVPCPTDEGYQLHSTSTGLPLCFKYFKYRVNWEQARERCHGDLAELIVLDSEEKDAFIVQYLNRHNRKGHITWVGLVKEIDRKIVYKWLNNSTHIRWGFEEPDVDVDQHCGQLDKGGISDMYCFELRRFICEKHFT